MIPDDLIEDWMSGTLFGKSEPGAIMHHMLFGFGKPDDVNALGLPDPSKLSSTGFLLAPVGAPGEAFDSDKWVNQQIRRAIDDHRNRNTVVYFAALAVEEHLVESDGNEVTENRARRMRADLQLQEHPAAVEVTNLYAACRDGRTWTGEHILTGPNAGKITGPVVCNPGDGPPERGLRQRLIRAAVGLR